MYLPKFLSVSIAVMLVSSAQAEESSILNIFDIETTWKVVPVASYGLRSATLSSSDVYYAINSSNFGCRIIAATGVAVTNGTKATLKFDITMRGITTNMIDAQDHYFESSLNETEKESYHAMKQSYDGGLTIPMLNWIGINLAADVEKEDMDRSAQYTRNYNELAHHVQNVMNITTEQTIRIKGTIEAEGTSPVPTYAYAFIQVAQVELTEGNEKMIVSSGGQDLAAGTKDGNTIPFGTGELSLVPVLDYVAP